MENGMDECKCHERIAGQTNDRRSECRRDADYANDSGWRNRQRAADHHHVGAVVFGRLADGRQEHAFGSPFWQYDVHADEHSADGTGGVAVCGALGLHHRAGPSREIPDAFASSASAAGKLSPCPSTIVSPADLPPVSQMPPALL